MKAVYLFVFLLVVMIACRAISVILHKENASSFLKAANNNKKLYPAENIMPFPASEIASKVVEKLKLPLQGGQEQTLYHAILEALLVELRGRAIRRPEDFSDDRNVKGDDYKAHLDKLVNGLSDSLQPVVAAKKNPDATSILTPSLIPQTVKQILGSWKSDTNDFCSYE